ncbi:hypothetical protein JCM11641_003635 [Rhodosporidiobolus odoratus]
MATSSIDTKLPPLPDRQGWRSTYAHPLIQTALIALICFGCPGMFNALSGVGGGGQLDPKAANDGNVALYSTFAVVGFFSGSIINKIGARLAFSIGASGYALYMGSLLSLNINRNNDFVVAAGALLGVCAGLLWTAQGSLTLAYATEATKGRAFAFFWIIFNLGGVVGAAIELGLTYDSSSNTVGNGVYIVFLTIGACACFLPLLLVNPATMVRVDGTRVVVPVHPSWRNEIIGMYDLFRRDYWILFLVPFFVASNFTTAWQTNSFNGALFTLRTRSLNSLDFWLAQMFGAGLFGLAIDMKRFRRTSRAWGGLVFLLVLNITVWGGSYHYQKDYHRTPDGASVPRIDLKRLAVWRPRKPRLNGPSQMTLATILADWLMGSLYSNAGDLARIVGIYKGIQSAAAAGAWRMDSVGTAYMTELAATWAVCVVALVCAVPVILFRLHDQDTEDPVVEAVLADSNSIASAGDEKKVAEV